MNKDVSCYFEPDELTTDINQAIYLFKDGSMVSGEFDCGSRGLDHNCLLSQGFKDYNELHRATGVVRLVPETQTALILANQHLSKRQQSALSNSDYIIEEY